MEKSRTGKEKTWVLVDMVELLNQPALEATLPLEISVL